MKCTSNSIFSDITPYFIAILITIPILFLLHQLGVDAWRVESLVLIVAYVLVLFVVKKIRSKNVGEMILDITKVDGEETLELGQHYKEILVEVSYFIPGAGIVFDSLEVRVTGPESGRMDFRIGNFLNWRGITGGYSRKSNRMKDVPTGTYSVHVGNVKSPIRIDHVRFFAVK